jgi:HEAT repeat protein
VLPKGQTALPNSAPRGVKIQRVGDSLEFIVPVKPGASVTVQPRFNRLDLVVSGGIQDGANGDAPPAQHKTSSVESSARAPRPSAAPTRDGERQNTAENARAAAPQTNVKQRLAPVAGFAAEKVSDAKGKPAVVAPVKVSNALPAATSADTSAPVANASSVAPANAAAQQSNAQAQVATGETRVASAQQSADVGNATQQSSFIFSAKGLIGMTAAGFVAFFFVYRRRRSTGADDGAQDAGVTVKGKKKEESKAKGKEAQESEDESETLFEQAKGDRRRGGDRRLITRAEGERRKSGVGAEPQATRHTPPAVALDKADKNNAKSPVTRMPSASSMPAVLFGAYRINEEVGKLLQGEAHSIEVLASRASDDRRAIETSLIKALRSRDVEADGHRRAQTALEEYGFVARQSAMLLLAGEAYERASAARVLGEVKSASALPFLLEALYDPESVVRTEVVSSLGALRLPRAIGALIDMARRYPEMPVAMLRPALNACSVDSEEPDGFEPAESRTPLVYVNARESFTGEIVGLEIPEDVEQLPEWLENETLADALERLSDTDIEARTVAAQSLAQFQVQRSVDALAAMSVTDVEATVRAAAVTSLGVLDHESVFAPVLKAMADEAREVRAAAARSLSRLSFDRADAYVRVIETASTETLRGVAQACVKAGLAAQALDRLTSTDRRQAYEAFSLLSLVVKAGELSLVLEAIAQHGSVDVRLAAIRLLCMMGRPVELLEPLRRLAERGGMPEKVRGALKEAIEQMEPSDAVLAGRNA